MDIAGCETVADLGIGLRSENAAGPVQHEDIARQWCQPAGPGNTRRQYFVEYKGARSRQIHTRLLPRRPARTALHLQCELQIAATATESLLAEVIRHAIAGEQVAPGRERVDIAAQIAQHDDETVGAVSAAPQLSTVALDTQEAQRGIVPALPVGTAVEQMQTKPLPRHSDFALQAGITHLALAQPGKAREPLRGIGSVEVFLFDPEPAMFAATVGFEAHHFFDKKIRRRGAQHRGDWRLAISARPVGQRRLYGGHAVIRSSNTTAYAANPSSRPTNPSFSVVVALTLIRSIAHSRSAAMFEHMAAVCLATRGASAVSVRSALPRR